MHEIEEKWEEIKSIIKKEYDLTDISYNTWIEPLKFYKEENNVITILIPADQSTAINYISKKYKNYFQVSISEMFDKDYMIEFMLEKDVASDEPENEKNNVYNINNYNTNLNPRYNFETFVVGSNNKLAHAAALAVAESPGEVYNPLFLYGGPGLGKTHLMHSIGHFILQQNPNKKVLYVNSEEFTNEVIESIRSGNAASMNKFREKYRTLDVLLLDDVQFIIGKESTQEEFFHTFNALHNDGKQIILSSDKPPKDMETLDERFKSRFEWGLIADIQPPEYETRMAILKKNADLIYDNKIDDEILDYIAKNVKSNIRELEGSLRKVIAASRLNNEELTLQLAEDSLKDMINPDKNVVITPEYIIKITADHFSVSEDDIYSSKRTADIALPRQVCMYLIKKHTESNYEFIAKLLRKNDHTTIMHGVKKIKSEIANNSDLKNKIDAIEKKLNV
ncbi:MAG: chromosomal replication initiator protein DnaA [Lachnospiraceae bacterium]|nr:chromosomal replication initiator protein DnaA [Lachnospiraceae bacterium]